jgi:hypothetical protein
VSFNRGRVERQRDSIFAGLGQRFKDRAPSSALGPPVEAIVDGRVRAVFTRAIAPSRTRLQHVNDSADDTPVVVPIWPRQSRRQMRLDTRPLPVIQPKQTRAHSLAPESKPRGKGITSRYSGTDPKHRQRSVDPPDSSWDRCVNRLANIAGRNTRMVCRHVEIWRATRSFLLFSTSRRVGETAGGVTFGQCEGLGESRRACVPKLEV